MVVFSGQIAQMQRTARDLELGCSGWSDAFCYSGHTVYDGDHLLADAMDHIEQVLQSTTPSKHVSGNMGSMQRYLGELPVTNVAKDAIVFQDAYGKNASCGAMHAFSPEA